MVRDDLADVNVADQVFAPHYARGLPQTLSDAVQIYAKPSVDADHVGALMAGEQVDVFDLSGGWAWVRSRLGPGYVSAETVRAR